MTDKNSRNQKYYDEHHLEFERQGKEYKAKRLALEISLKEMAAGCHCSAGLIYKLERGAVFIRRRDLLVAAYERNLEYIPIKRQINAGQIFLLKS